MTSNAEEPANTPAAATVQQPKATQRAHVAPHKRRVAPGKPRSPKKASSAEPRPKNQKAAKQAKPAAGAREGSKAAKVLGLLRRPDGASFERANESYRLTVASAFIVPDLPDARIWPIVRVARHPGRGLDDYH